MVQVTEVQIIATGFVWTTRAAKTRAVVLRRRPAGQTKWAPLETMGASGFPDGDHCEVHSRFCFTALTYVVHVT